VKISFVCYQRDLLVNYCGLVGAIDYDLDIASLVCSQFGIQRRFLVTRSMTMIIEREGDGFVSICPDVDVASQGNTIEEARENLKEALELFFETASPEEIEERMHSEIYISRVEVAVA
jgi:predicted RNase H-like HicB family nuclease